MFDVDRGASDTPCGLKPFIFHIKLGRHPTRSLDAFPDHGLAVMHDAASRLAYSMDVIGHVPISFGEPVFVGTIEILGLRVVRWESDAHAS